MTHYSYSYSLDSLGRRTTRSESTLQGAKRDSYAYDPISQLTGVNYASGARTTYAYDAVGNRTSVTTTASGSGSGSGNSTTIPYLANACNQYTRIGGLLVSSDANGNLTSDQNGNTYTYDAQYIAVGTAWIECAAAQPQAIAVGRDERARASQNRVATARSGTNTMSVSYDARNRVVSRTINGVTTSYAYDGWNLIEDYDASGNELARYIHGPQSDDILAKISPTGAVYYIQDGNQNVTTITDGTGAVQERYSYDVYGTATITDASGNTLTVSGVGNRFLFTGRELISQIGIYDYRNRVYSATLGRFLQTDPIRFEAGDINIYRYVGNGPVNGTDPMGLYCQEGDASIDTDGDPNYNKYGTDGKYPDNKHSDKTSAGDKYDPTSPGVNAPYESYAHVGDHVKIEANGKSVDAVVFDKTDKAHAKEHTNKPEFNEAAAKALGLGVEHNNKSGPYPFFPGDKSHGQVHTKILF